VIILIIANTAIWSKVSDYRAQVIAINDPGELNISVLPSAKDPLAQIPTSQPKIVNKYVVPILMYHYIRDYTDASDPLGIQLSVAPTVFKAQLELLKKNGYHTISLSDFAAGKVSGKAIILTFDDGYDDHYTNALPILQQEGMTGTFFIIRNFIGRPRYMTQVQINGLQAAGMELGAHTLNHKDLSRLTPSAARQEIAGSLTSNLAPVFAYPSGLYNAETLIILHDLGVKAAVTTKLGAATDLNDPLRLPRIRVKQNMDLIGAINQQLAELKKVNSSSSATSNSAAGTVK
jgi:peptidoglycan/xylan/chitin deacetylase (PgdA/CDA1 family)